MQEISAVSLHLSEMVKLRGSTWRANRNPHGFPTGASESLYNGLNSGCVWCVCLCISMCSKKKKKENLWFSPLLSSRHIQPSIRL